MAASMTYEEHLDEVTTQLTERYEISDEQAIRMVMQAQENNFFCAHDDDPAICTLERAGRDAKLVFKTYGKKQGRTNKA